ncbi:MAG: class IIb bacteriocin, lactobin A/cerein 7B family [Bacilli bacterium]|nr:class IIb bacteriocin, lactobin A/cerein 7B family [Bacilli bacterium]
MTKLTDNDLRIVEGGGIKVGVLAAIAGFGVFIIGVFDGLIRPLKCLKK